MAVNTFQQQKSVACYVGKKVFMKSDATKNPSDLGTFVMPILFCPSFSNKFSVKNTIIVQKLLIKSAI